MDRTTELVELMRETIRDISEEYWSAGWLKDIEYIVFRDIFYKPEGSYYCTEYQANFLRNSYSEVQEWPVYDSSLTAKYWESSFEDWIAKVLAKEAYYASPEGKEEMRQLELKLFESLAKRRKEGK